MLNDTDTDPQMLTGEENSFDGARMRKDFCTSRHIQLEANHKQCSLESNQCNEGTILARSFTI